MFLRRAEIIEFIQKSIAAEDDENSILEELDDDQYDEERVDSVSGNSNDSLNKNFRTNKNIESPKMPMFDYDDDEYVEDIETIRKSKEVLNFASDGDQTIRNEEDEYNNEDFYEDDKDSETNRTNFQSDNLFEFEIQQVLNNFPSHCNIKSIPTPKKYKNGTRLSLTFTNERMREIERHNQILLRKIIKSGPQSTCPVMPRAESRLSRKSSAASISSVGSSVSRTSSAALNRRKQSQQIDYENQILRKKLENIHHSRRKSFCWNKNV